MLLLLLLMASAEALAGESMMVSSQALVEHNGEMFLVVDDRELDRNARDLGHNPYSAFNSYQKVKHSATAGHALSFKAFADHYSAKPPQHYGRQPHHHNPLPHHPQPHHQPHPVPHHNSNPLFYSELHKPHPLPPKLPHHPPPLPPYLPSKHPHHLPPKHPHNLPPLPHPHHPPIVSQLPPKPHNKHHHSPYQPLPYPSHHDEPAPVVRVVSGVPGHPGEFLHHLSGRRFVAGKIIPLSKAIELGIIAENTHFGVATTTTSSSEEDDSLEDRSSSEEDDSLESRGQDSSSSEKGGGDDSLDIGVERDVPYTDDEEEIDVDVRAGRQFQGDDDQSVVEEEEEEEKVIQKGNFFFKFKPVKKRQKKQKAIPDFVIKSNVVKEQEKVVQDDVEYEYENEEEIPNDVVHSAAAEVILGQEQQSDNRKSEQLVIVENNDDDNLQFWPYLNSTWKPDQSKGFFAQPRTEAEAIEQGWVKISDCGDESGSRFPGRRYLQSLGDDNLDDLVLIFDLAGFIAGVQSLVPVDVIGESEAYDFEEVPFYQKDSIKGREVYFVTAYFVDPGLVCGGGRTPEQFSTQGTGYALYLQSGPSIDNRVSVPITRQGADTDAGWSRKACAPTMGQHYFPFTYDDAAEDACQFLTPFSITYGGDNKLNGFAFTHVAALTGNRWEVENASKIGLEVGDAPECYADLVSNPGVRSMHFFLGDNNVQC